ncbi:MAG: DUF721 domain-containing protein [Paludibacteraceae bacterium]|nr:DUF721 domain-containing protein [Paludibacteraceae bacterium]
MKRVSVTPIGKILSAYFDEVGIGEKIREQRLLDNMESVLGSFICKYVNRKYINNKVLYIYVTNSVLRGELSMNKHSLIERLNASVSSDVMVIKDLVVR